jgi:AraC family transcriptional regulator
MGRIPINPPAAELATASSIVTGSARRYELDRFSGPLSVKSVVRGVATWETASGRFEIGPGTALILNDREEYSLTIDSPQPVETFCVFFATGFVEDARHATVNASDTLLDGGSAPAATFSERLAYGGPLVAAMALVRRSRDEAAIVALAQVLARTLCDTGERMERLPAARAATRAELHRRIAMATEYIHANLGEPLSLEAIAAAARLSPFHCHRVFHSYHGVTPHEYITRLRLARSRMLMSSSSRTVLEIAQDCGFESATSFSALFRKAFGVPPGRFRKIEEEPHPDAE